MTLKNAPWAIDGALTTSALARLATYAASGGQSGVIRPADLKVSTLAVPGNGVRIAAGGALVMNRYQTSINEAYVVSNPSTHTVPSGSMPASNPATSYYLVCVVVGDPEFSSVGHPYMPSSIPAEDAPDFEYVRVVVVPCSSTTTRFDQLGLNYPAYALARLEIPASTTTITSGMIVDVRDLANARELRKVLAASPTANVQLTSSSFTDTWISYKPTVAIPVWATRATVTVTIAQTFGIDAVVGSLRAKLGALVGPTVTYDINDSGNGYRTAFTFTLADVDVTALAGTNQVLAIEALRSSGAGRLETRGGTQVIYDVQFSERVV
jgi:hypothetical protein